MELKAVGEGQRSPPLLLFLWQGALPLLLLPSSPHPPAGWLLQHLVPLQGRSLGLPLHGLVLVLLVGLPLHGLISLVVLLLGLGVCGMELKALGEGQRSPPLLLVLWQGALPLLLLPSSPHPLVGWVLQLLMPLHGHCQVGDLPLLWLALLPPLDLRGFLVVVVSQ